MPSLWSLLSDPIVLLTLTGGLVVAYGIVATTLTFRAKTEENAWLQLAAGGSSLAMGLLMLSLGVVQIVARNATL